MNNDTFGRDLKAEHALVLAALEAANAAWRRVVTVAELLSVLSPADRQRLETAYTNDLSTTAGKIMTLLSARGLVFSPGKIGRTRYYGSVRSLDPEASPLPDQQSRRQTTLQVVRGAVEASGVALLLGDILEHTRQLELPPEVTEDTLTMDIVSLAQTEDLQTLRIPGDERGSTLYLPKDLTWDDYAPVGPVTWLHAVSLTVDQLWEERCREAEAADRKPRPLSTGDVRRRLADCDRFVDRLADPQLLVNALRHLAGVDPPILCKLSRRSERANLWVPTGVEPHNVDLGSAYTTDAERVAEAVRRAESGLGRPVTVHDVRDEIDMDPSLRPAGSGPLHTILSDLSKTQIAGIRGKRTERATQRVAHVGTVAGRAYYAAERVEEGKVYTQLATLEKMWQEIAVDEELSAIDGCLLGTVALGRLRLLRAEIANAVATAREILGSAHADSITLQAANTLLQEATERLRRVEEHVAQRAPGWPNLPDDVSVATPGWTAAELQTEFESLYPRASEVDAPKKLVPLLQKAIRRVRNPEFERRFESKPNIAAEYLFDRTDALICAATRWGGVECRLQAMLAKAELGRLRDARFITPMLASKNFDVRLRAVSCLAFLQDPETLNDLRRVAEDDPESGLRDSAYWAYGFAGGFDAASIVIRNANEAEAEFVGRAERLPVPGSPDWWLL